MKCWLIRNAILRPNLPPKYIKSNPPHTTKHRKMIDSAQLKNRFQEVFGTAAQLLAKSPGRINLIGEHTDYNNGFVLPTAIDKAIYVAVGKREDAIIRLYAEDFGEYFETD